MEKYTKQHPPCARAMIIYPSDSSSPTLPIEASMAQRWMPKKPDHPPIEHCHCPRVTPVSFRGAHGVLRFGGVYWLSWPWGKHAAALYRRDKRGCFVVASCRPSGCRPRKLRHRHSDSPSREQSFPCRNVLHERSTQVERRSKAVPQTPVPVQAP